MATERALESAGAETVVAGWKDRRRADALLADIAAMGLAKPEPATPPVFQSEAGILGGVYVLEGSRLGGAMLVRTVAPGLPTSFLTPGNPADWRAFISLLGERLSLDIQLAEAATAAQAVFALFEQSARAQLEPAGLDR